MTSRLFGDAEFETGVRKALALTPYHNAVILKDADNDLHRMPVYASHVVIHPDSALVGGAHQWVVSSKLVLGARPYCQTVTTVDPVWLIVSPTICLVRFLVANTLLGPAALPR